VRVLVRLALLPFLCGMGGADAFPGMHLVERLTGWVVRTEPGGGGGVPWGADAARA
jgi:hypothetical protein